jgi:hypothetical protein
MVMLEGRMMTWRAAFKSAAVASAITEIFQCQSTTSVSLPFPISFKSRQSRILRRKTPLRKTNPGLWR